jgi:hypothetical protein
MEDPVYLYQYRLNDIVPHQLEVSVIEQMSNVLAATGEEVIEAEHLIPLT